MLEASVEGFGRAVAGAEGGGRAKVIGVDKHVWRNTRRDDKYSRNSRSASCCASINGTPCRRDARRGGRLGGGKQSVEGGAATTNPSAPAKTPVQYVPLAPPAQPGRLDRFAR